ncbi:hypothetical protein FQZ97_1017830 [compost metagenome]
MDALEDLREGLALLEVQATVVGGLRQPLATIVGPDQVRFGTPHRPAGTDRQRRVELPLDLANVEIDGMRRGDAAQGNGQGEDMWLEGSGPFCCFHAASLLGFLCWRRKLITPPGPGVSDEVVIRKLIPRYEPLVGRHDCRHETE